jgi:hypothetical protein
MPAVERPAMSFTPQIELFCGKAIRRGLLDESQCRIIKEMISVEAGLDEFVQTTLEFGVAQDPTAIEQLRDETMAAWNAMPTEDRLIVANEILAHSETKQSPNDTLGLDWFCFFAITEGCITKETCISIAAEVEDLTDVLMFAQAVIDHWTSDDYSKLQQCVDKAATMMSKSKAVPPFRIFGRLAGTSTRSTHSGPPPKSPQQHS